MRRRAYRRVYRLLVALVLSFVPAVLGTVVAVLYSEAGTLTLGRLLGPELTRIFRGQFEVGRVSGSFVRSVVLEDLVIRDTLGQPFASVPRLSVRFALPNLLAGRFVFDGAELDRPDIRIVKRRNGRLSHQEVFRLGEGPGGGRPALVELRNVRIRQGHIEVRLPWNPPDTARTTEQVAAALAADRARPGRVVLETVDGLRRVIEFDAVNVKFPRMLVSSPDRVPATIDLDSLSTRVSDPAVDLVYLSAHLWTRGDSLAFTAHGAALRNSWFTGGGVITWPRGPLVYDFTLDAPRLDLRDLRWISPDFPDMRGRALVTAHSRSEDLNAYTLRDLEIAGPEGRISGVVTALVDRRRGLGVEGMTLDLADLDLDVPRPYLDTIPLSGTLTGRLEGAGFRDGLDVVADLIFVDAAVEGGATSTLAAGGHLVLGGPDGTLFDTLAVAAADVDLRTVQLVTPAVELDGRAQLSGVLRGPWRAVTWEGAITHRDGEHPESHAAGTAMLDTRQDSLRFAARLDMAPLMFDGIRPSYPGIPIRGTVKGLVEAVGTTGRFRLVTAVEGDLGTLALNGTIVRGGGVMAAESLTARFANLDLAALRGTGPGSALAGRLALDGMLDTMSGPAGTMALDLSRGRVQEVAFDSLHAVVRGVGGQVAVDTLELRWPGGELAGSGILPWREAGEPGLRAAFFADSLTPFDSLVARFAGPVPDSVAPEPTRGRVAGDVEVLGSVREPRILLQARGEDLRWRGIRSPAVAFAFGWNRTARDEIGAALHSDSVVADRWRLNELNLVAGGFRDSLRWAGNGVFGGRVLVAGGGEYWSRGPVNGVSFDSLIAALPQRAWRLSQPATLTLTEGRVDLTPVRLEAGDGSGLVTMTGSVPRSRPGRLRVNALGVEVRDAYALLERDTTGVSGTLQMDLEVAGTAAQPTMQGTASLEDLSFGDLGSPYVQGVVDYADRRLEVNLLMWRTGQPVLRVESALPLDLALRTVRRRQVGGALFVRIVADSTDLGLAEAFTRNLRRVRGTLRADVEVTGTWDAPLLGGVIAIEKASANVPGLGVRYEGVSAAARLASDSVILDSLIAQSGEGTLRATGSVRLVRLTRPVLNLALRARRFRAIAVRRFLTLDATGTARVAGPIFGARLTGRVTADAGNLQFADLITKRIVDLENPGDSGLIDLDLIRTERLGANFSNRFVDSLTVDTLQIQMGESFWLRSSEADIQLDGNVTVNKVRDRYRFDGTLNAVRGNYALRIGGIVSREFTVDRGTVRYFGTPDLNAELDIEATHVVTAAETSEEIPVTARITGTLLQPKLQLLSPPTATRPGLSQTELVSYLMFGRPTFSLQGQGAQGSQYAAVQAGVSYLTSAFSSELQRTLVSDLGVPIDYLDIRAGSAGGASIGGQSGSAQVAQVAAGWQIGRKWFVSLVADLCTNAQRFYPNAEFRMSRQLRLKTSVEPAYTCQAAQVNPALSTNKYQVGLDVLWEREY